MAKHITTLKVKKMKTLAYIYLEAYEDDNGIVHYSSKADGNSVDLTMLIAYLYHDQPDLVETAVSDEVQATIKDETEKVYIH